MRTAIILLGTCALLAVAGCREQPESLEEAVVEALRAEIARHHDPARRQMTARCHGCGEIVVSGWIAGAAEMTAEEFGAAAWPATGGYVYVAGEGLLECPECETEERD